MEKMLDLKDGTRVPRLGQGTWFMGESRQKEKEEIEALQRGIELGMTLIDTAEMYGEGASETLIGKAIKGTDRESLFLVSKVYPFNAGRKNLERSLDNSLKRLQTDYLDLYLLHWRGAVPFAETIEEMERMIRLGKIKHFGVSNLDIDEMKEFTALCHGHDCMVDEVLYHLGSRGIEYSLLPWLKEQQIPVMAYCPLAQGGSLSRGILEADCVKKAAHKYGVSKAAVLLNFVLQQENVIAIPKASAAAHVNDNAAALEFSLTNEDMAELSAQFPAPVRKEYLDIV